MNDPDRSAAMDASIRTMQIIASALIAGIVAFAGVTILLGSWNAPVEAGVLKYIGLLLPVLEIVPFVLVPASVTKANFAQLATSQDPSRDQEIGTLLGIYQVRMIVRFALIEGAAFLNLIAFQLEHARWSLGVVGVLLLILFALFPTRTRVEQFVETAQVISSMDR